MKKQLTVSIHGTTKHYRELYVDSLGTWVELVFPYWAREMTRTDLKEWLKGRFPDYELKFLFSK